MTKSSVEATGAQRKGNAICQWCDSPFKSKRKLKAHISGTHRDKLASNADADDDDDPDTPSPDTSSPETQDALLQLGRLRDYDDNLFFDFRDLFEGWRSFQNVNQKVLQRLRRRLHRRGVYTGDDRKSAAQALNDLNQLPCPDESRWPDPPNWPDDELLAATLSTRSQAFKRQEKLKKRAKEKLNQKPTVKKPTVKKHTTKKTVGPTIVRPFATGGSLALPSQEKKETVQNDYISDGEDYSYEEVDSDSALDDDVCDD